MTRCVSKVTMWLLNADTLTHRNKRVILVGKYLYRWWAAADFASIQQPNTQATTFAVPQQEYTMLKRCRECGDEMTLGFFRRVDRRLCRVCERELWRNRYACNRERVAEYYRRWYIDNRDKILEQKLEARLADPDKINARERARYWANRSRILRQRQLEREKYAKWFRQWKANNREAWHALKARRRAMEMGADGHFGKTDLVRIYAVQSGQCIYCKRELRGRYHVDHIIPLVRGGSNHPENIACACERCNLSKGSKLLDEWEAIRGW
jgi:5-methylcytosine-specific restriction endonuclease McrA